MNMQNLIQKIDDSIKELSDLKKELIDFYSRINDLPRNIPRMMDIFRGIPSYNGLDRRVANILSAHNLYEIPVEVFVMKCSPEEFLTYRWSGKESVEYVKRILKEEYSIDWK